MIAEPNLVRRIIEFLTVDRPMLQAGISFVR
jgi:hypothetical protein